MGYSICVYYVYAHSTPDGKVFYVGKGSKNRLHQTGNRNEFWKRIVRKYGYSSSVLDRGLTEAEALASEIRWIAFYKARGECQANFTDGGDSVRVAKRWWGPAISRSLMGVKRKSGRESKSFKDLVTKEQLQNLYVEKGLSSVAIQSLTGLSYSTLIDRLREFGIPVRNAGRAQKPIKCLNDGRVFGSMTEAARHYGIFRENIRKVINGEYRHTGGKRFAYLTNNIRNRKGVSGGARGDASS